MTNNRKPACDRKPAGASQPSAEAPDFNPVPVRPRHDGWTADKQLAFIKALAESGCVEEACRTVGMSSVSAYRLRARADAQSFRYAWEFALDHAITRLSDAIFSRAINGVARPVFYQGEQIGERRYYDERLAMWLLRYRDPVRYGAWRDDKVFRRHPDGATLAFSQALNRLEDDAFGAEAGAPVDQHSRLSFPRIISPEEEQARIDEALEQQARAAEFRELAERDAEFERWLEKQTPERTAAYERWEAERNSDASKAE